jgi:phosphoribosylaminoimidazole carboxylase (NCAIR synthetase)
MQDSVLIFGGGELQVSIINKAKSLGLKAIVIDPNGSGSSKGNCRRFYMCSWR